MTYYRYRDLCLCPSGGTLPEGTVSVAEPFSPLVFLVDRDPLVSRGFFAICSLAELYETEGVNLLGARPEQDAADNISSFVIDNGACVLNTAFARAFDVLEQYLKQKSLPPRVQIVGLGNVGGTVATALKLLGADLAEIGIFDNEYKLCLRYEAELNQVLPVGDGIRLPPVVICPEESIFDCDAVLFTAAAAVPEVGAESGGDVRMMQFEANRGLLRAYARRARACGFLGWFFQVSDPVDQLSRAVYLMSNQNEHGEYDWRGLLPEQVRGLGLGVMRARAVYAAEQLGIHTEEIRAYGPHGKGLVIANAPDEGYDDALSHELTRAAETANLTVRSYGFKPYIAPGLSSAAISALRALRGEWHDAAVPIGCAYFGCRARFCENGPEVLREPLHPRLQQRIEASYLALKELNAG
jgi:hypothetical protein